MVEVGENGEKVQQQGKQNKLIEADDPFTQILGNALIQAGMNYLPVNRPDKI